ncbi:MAG: CRISPR-associated endonuclease Cas2 [Dehalococcoidia bacterium]|nr:CRISPR-associated endonuclease Cas2 [Dehalococcoidia bacterium]
MFVIVAYDVSTETEAGKRRLRRVAKVCERYGQRVQKSVFECNLGSVQLVRLRGQLLDEIDARHDSLRLYFLGEDDRKRTEQYGRGHLWDFEGPLIV